MKKYSSDDEKIRKTLAKLQSIDVEGLNNLWPVSWYINGWTDYSLDQMLACKGPGE